MLKAAVNKLGETSDLQLLLRTALASAEKRGGRPWKSERVISGWKRSEDQDLELTLRPRTLREYVGQEKVKADAAVHYSSKTAQ